MSDRNREQPHSTPERPAGAIAPTLTRRQLLGTAAALTTGALAGPGRSMARDGGWDSGRVAHLLPTASHDRFLIKASLSEPISGVPTLNLGRRNVEGTPTDTQGLFWLFDADGLEAATDYELRLRDGGGTPLCDDWPLRTFPNPESSPEHARVLLFTCAGGHPDLRRGGLRHYLPLSIRRRLLQRALSFAPDAVIANGDHIYWDQRTPGPNGPPPEYLELAGHFDRSQTVLGTANETVLKRAVGPQVADLYGTLMRSAPVFFLQDDHDYFDGDRVRSWVVPYPPDPFMIRAARASQRLFYPEFLPDSERPLGLPSASMADRPPGVGEAFGTLRYGRLLEVLLYDCRRHQTIKGDLGTLVPEQAEKWLLRRMADPKVGNLVQVPSLPLGWTAGKWGEWYPDILAEDGTLGLSRAKDFWQQGWLLQHDRLLKAASAMERSPIFLNGDLHSIAEATIYSSGDLDLSANPIRTALVGPIGTLRGWPSGGRGTVGQLSTVLRGEEALGCVEENGFLIADFDPEGTTLRFFRWRPGDRQRGVGNEEDIDSLEPFRTVRWPRRPRQA